MATILYKYLRSKFSDQASKANTEAPETTETLTSTSTPGPQTCRHVTAASSSSPCLECKAEKKAATKYRWTIILGLLFPFTLQALDATM